MLRAGLRGLLLAGQLQADALAAAHAKEAAAWDADTLRELQLVQEELQGRCAGAKARLEQTPEARELLRQREAAEAAAAVSCVASVGGGAAARGGGGKRRREEALEEGEDAREGSPPAKKVSKGWPLPW